jgi:hypothetical protein
VRSLSVLAASKVPNSLEEALFDTFSFSFSFGEGIQSISMSSTLQMTDPKIKGGDDEIRNRVPKGGIIGGRQSSHHSFYSIKSKLSPLPYDEEVEKGQYPKGFLNVGNSCYANATLQCLLSTALADALLDPKTLPLFRKYSSNPNILAMGSGSVDSEDVFTVGTREDKHDICPGNEQRVQGLHPNILANPNILAMGSEGVASKDAISVVTRKSQKSIFSGGNEQSSDGIHDNCAWLMAELRNITEDYLGRDQFVRPASGWSWYQSGPIKKRVVDPGNITRFPDRLSSCLRPYKQEDAHEFLRGLLSTLMKHGKNRQLSSLFDGLLESAVTCGNCGKVSIKRDRYMDLSLDINDDDIRTLEDALLYYTSSEVLSGDNSVYCRKCKTKHTATKGLRLATAPSILVCHLKQYAIDAYGRLTRLHKKIDFPMQLEIGDYMSHLNHARPPTYGLRGMLVHRGQTCASGHYVAYVLRKGEWFECNDSVVTKVDEETVLSQRAYILIYEVAEMREQTSRSTRRNSTTPSAVSATTDNTSKRYSPNRHDNILFEFFLKAEIKLVTCLEKIECGPCALKEDEEDEIDDVDFTYFRGPPPSPAGSLEQRRHSFNTIEPGMSMEEDTSPEPIIPPSQSMRRAKSTVGFLAREVQRDEGTISAALIPRHLYSLPVQTNPSGTSRSNMTLLDSTPSSGEVSKAAAYPSKLQPKRPPLAAKSVNPTGASRSSMTPLDSTQSSGGVSKAAAHPLKLQSKRAPIAALSVDPCGNIRSSRILDPTQSSRGVSKGAHPSRLQPKRAPLEDMSVNARELPPLPKRRLRSPLQKFRVRVY